MDKEELKAALDAKGIKYHHKAGVKKLAQLLKESEVKEIVLDHEPTEKELEVINEDNQGAKVDLKVERRCKSMVFNQQDYKKAWIGFNSMLETLKSSDAYYFLITSKDTNALDAIELFEKANGDVLSLYPIPSMGGNWTGKPATKTGNFHLSHWMDNDFICSRALFEAIDWKVPPPPKNWNPNNASNGIGGFLSRAAVAAGLKLYHL